VGLPERDLHLREKLDELFTEHPTRVTRRLSEAPAAPHGDRHHVSQEESLCASPLTQKISVLAPGVAITRPNQVWSIEITYVRVAKGFVYLTAIIDWYSRYGLSWKLSTTLDRRFCIEALEEALETYGQPEIFNTDQGCQYTSDAFTGILKAKQIKISMDGKGRALDTGFVERLWRTVKQEEVYLKGYRHAADCREGLRAYFDRYNNLREHQSLEYNYPAEICFGDMVLKQAA